MQYETYGESTMETYITICKTDSHWEFAEGWVGAGDGREVQKGGEYVYLWLNHVEV